MNIVLIEPEIPGNTGNIARLCAATESVLHLVEPLGFSTDDKYLKRAGLDYWHLLKVYYHKSFHELKYKYPNGRFFYLSTKAPHVHTEISYKEDDFLVFGKESAGIPESILEANWENCVRIPMIKEARSLNLSNAVAITLYEALRQTEYASLECVGPGLRLWGNEVK